MLGGTTSELKILLSLKDQASAKLQTFSSSFKNMAMNMVKVGAMAGAAAAAGLGVKAIKSAADFEKAMGNVATLVDTSTENMTEMGKKVKEMSKRVPVDIGELTEALYQVRSAGIDASDAMSVLEESGRLAVAGLGTTTEATDLLTSAFNVFAQQGYEADEIANILFKSVKAGKTTVSELAQSFGMVAPIAGEMNVKFDELQAATAALTTTGMKASVAQTQLRAGLVSLLRPTGDMEDLFTKLGVTSGRQLLETSGGLVEAFNKIKTAAEGDDAALAKAFGSVEALNAILALTSGEVGESFINTLGTMRSETDLLTEGFEKQKSTTHAQFQLLKSELGVALMDLGERILPYVIKAVKWLIDYFHKMAEGIRVVKDAINAVKNAWSTAKSMVGGAIGNVKGFLGFQKGGIVPGPIGAPVPAIVHGGEKIIPAGKARVGLGGGITINITGTFLSEDVAEKIGDMIIDKLKTQTRFAY